MNQASTTTQPPLAPAEAQALRDKTKQCAVNLAKKADALRALVTEFLLGGGPEVLGIDEAEFRKEICESSGRHHTTVSRHYLAGVMDVDLKLPPGDVNEWALRELRTRVPKEACADVIELARQEVGSYREITAQSIVSAAEQLGCLKPPTTKATASRGNQATADQCEATATARGRGAAASDRVEGILARVHQLDRLQHDLKSLLSQLGTQKELLREVAALGPPANGELLQRLEDLS